MSHPCCICSKHALGPYAERSYCLEHRPHVGFRVVVADVDCARIALADGASLRETAQHLNVMSADLDLALWENFGRAPAARRYQPDFVA